MVRRPSAAIPATKPTNQSGIRPVVPVLDISLTKFCKRASGHWKETSCIEREKFYLTSLFVSPL
jgi:hypothetical protein